MQLRWRGSIGLPLLISLFVAACAPAAPGSPPAASQPAAGGKSSSLQTIIDAANQEGSLVWADSGKAEIITELNKRFNQFFGVNVTVEQAPLPARAANTRIRQEIAAGKVTLDVMHPSSGIVAGLRQDNINVLVDPVDWNSVFGARLPLVKDVTDRAPQAWRGQVLEYQHLLDCVIYNTKFVSEADAPKSWDDLLDPKWKGKKIVLDPRGSSTYKHFVKWGVEKSQDYMQKLIAQDPLWVSQSPAIAEAVARGDGAIGVTSISNAVELLKSGQPIRVAKTEFVPGVQQVMVPIKGSPHPNAALLWAAWMATDGVKLSGELGDTSERSWPDLDTGSAKLVKDLGLQIEMITDPKQILEADAQQEALGKMIERAGVKAR